MNSTPWVKDETFEILHEILPYVNFSKPEFADVGAELIFPLLRLLQTEYSEKALTALELTSMIPASSKDKFVLKTSLGDKEAKDEYEKTATIFGVPDENGWSIPLSLRLLPIVAEATCMPCSIHALSPDLMSLLTLS